MIAFLENLLVEVDEEGEDIIKAKIISLGSEVPKLLKVNDLVYLGKFMGQKINKNLLIVNYKQILTYIKC